MKEVYTILKDMGIAKPKEKFMGILIPAIFSCKWTD